MSTFDTPRPIRAQVDLTAGAVHVHAASVEATTVAVTPCDPSNSDDVQVADQTTVELDGHELVIRGPRRGGMGMVRSWLSRGWGGSVDVTVELPTESSLAVSLGCGDIDADGRLGHTRVRTGLGTIRVESTGALDGKTGAGAVTVDRASGRVDLTTGSGTIRLGEVAGSAMVRNSNGITRVATVGGDLRVQAANGDIEVGRASGDVVAKSANGSIRVDEVVRGSVVCETHVGDVELGIREGTAAWLDLDTTTGRVDNRLDSATDPGTATDKVEVRARTTLGQILVRRPAGRA